MLFWKLGENDGYIYWKDCGKEENYFWLYDYILYIFGSLFVALAIVLFLGISPISTILLIVLGYLVYYLISLRKIEYEYAFTNGELDIDKIIAQRKRKRVFSASCRDFEAFGKLDSEKYTDEIKNIPQK